MGSGEWRILIHGGCGMLERGRIAAEAERGAREGLERALKAASALLVQGGAALEAVEQAVRVLEDDPHFNAGRGSVLTYQGTIEMDAAIMTGATREAGAVNGVTATRYPVSLARAVMERSPHVFLSREGADEFSRQQELEQAPPSWFHTEERRRQLAELRGHGDDYFDIDVKYGTVGAVAIDAGGHVAAATSTGGLTGKRWGRIGDCPVIGAGTYADDRAGAVSATGAGEYFLRVAAAHEICARLRFAEEAAGAPPSAQEAQDLVDSVLAEIGELGGHGGIILVTRRGDAVARFTTPGMYRGEASPAGLRVAVFGDEG